METEATEAVHLIARYVKAFRAERAENELEIRLGSIDCAHFQAGIDKNIFDQLERDLQDAPTLTTDNRWIEILDYHFLNQRSQPARTRVTYDSDGMTLLREHISKCNLEHVVLARNEGGEEACKIVRAREAPLTDVPNACIPTHVRVKQRKRYLDVRDGNTVWSYELARTWSATTRTAVEHLQQNSEPRYEVEVELIDSTGAYLEAHDDAEVATSLLMKAALLLGEESSSALSLSSHRLAVPEAPRRRKRRTPPGECARR